MIIVLYLSNPVNKTIIGISSFVYTRKPFKSRILSNSVDTRKKSKRSILTLVSITNKGISAYMIHSSLHLIGVGYFLPIWGVLASSLMFKLPA